MEIKPPYGYSRIAPLVKTARVELPADGTIPQAFRSMHAIPLSSAEIPLASRDYPIAFVSGDGERSYLAVAILGLEQEQNLFVDASGAWDTGAYLPAYVRRYPFCMARVTIEGNEKPDRVACVEMSALTARGEALHDEKGEPLPEWEKRKALLFEFETDLARTEEMCGTLKGLGLLEPFTMQAVPRNEAPLAMIGLHRVPEQKLADLPADQLKTLVQNGVLAQVYAHVHSQLNFQRLLDRRAAKASSATTAG